MSAVFLSNNSLHRHLRSDHYAKSTPKGSAKPPPPSAPLTTERSAPERFTPTLSADANLLSGALSSSPKPSDQIAPSEFLVQLARAAPTGQKYDPAVPIVALGDDDFQEEDSQDGSTYVPMAQGGDDGIG